MRCREACRSLLDPTRRPSPGPKSASITEAVACCCHMAESEQAIQDCMSQLPAIDVPRLAHPSQVNYSMLLDVNKAGSCYIRFRSGWLALGWLPGTQHMACSDRQHFQWQTLSCSASSTTFSCFWAGWAVNFVDFPHSSKVHTSALGRIGTVAQQWTRCSKASERRWWPAGVGERGGGGGERKMGELQGRETFEHTLYAQLCL